MDQISFSEAEYGLKKGQTRKEKSLAQMDQLLPWKRTEKLIKRYYPKAGKGRHPYGHASSSLHAIVLQPERSGDGRRAAI